MSIQDSDTDNKRLSKNTLVLYLRMIFTMVLNLYTSRLVLQALGVVDFGIYNVVGGVVTMLSFINSSLGNANSRFIAVTLGKGDESELKKVFSCIITIHYFFALILLLVFETVGLWFVQTQLVIPADRMAAAMWVYQSAVLSSVILIISSPYNGMIIAHERMGAFAFISIMDAVLKFGLALTLLYVGFDKLIYYAILHVLIQVLIRFIYVIYCKRNFVESKYKLMYDKEVSRPILSFAGWTLTGNLAMMGYTQGLNILLNIFFGPVVNAARGVSVQVQAAARTFFASFQTAINPQILKSYAQEDLGRMHTLIVASSRFSFYLMLIVTIPLCLHTQYVLELWLGNVPDYSAPFVQIMLIVSLINTLQNPTMTALHATGKLKTVQIVESSLLLLVVPVAYICLRFFHINPVEVFIVYFIIEFITQFVRVFMIYPMIKLPISHYFTKVLWPLTKVTVLSAGLCYILCNLLNVHSFFMLCVASISYFIIIVLIVYCFGIFNTERAFVNNYISKIIKR